MLKKPLLVMLAILMVGACTKSASPPPATETVTETASPSETPSASPSPENLGPTDHKVGDCVIEPGADCPGDNLRGQNLHNAKLQKSNLTNVNLTNSDLRYANLRKADLENAKARNADLKWAKLNNANLKGADLTNANLDGANFKGATLAGTKLKGAYICKTVWTDGSVRNTSCEPSPTATPSASPSPAAKTVTIKYFNVSPRRFKCRGGRNQLNLAQATYGTKGAKSVTITDQHEGGIGTSGEVGVEVPCKKNTQPGTVFKFTLTAIGKDGSKKSQTDSITTK